MANTSTTELDLLKNITTSGGATDALHVVVDSATTLALESGGNLATIAARTPALGQTTSAASSPVVLPSDQTVAVSAATLPLPTNAVKESMGNLDTLTVLIQLLIAETRKTNLLLAQMSNTDYSAININDLLPDQIFN